MTTERKMSSQRDFLVALASDAELWHDGDGEAYATVRIDAHLEHYRLRSRAFKSWLNHQYYVKAGGATSTQAMEDALRTIVATALFEGPRHEAAVRVAEQNGAVYVDLGEEDWWTAEIRPDGWQLLQESPVRFIRPKGLRALPWPEYHGSIHDLRQHLNIRDERDYKLLLGWLLMSFSPRGPYPVLFLNGEAGSAKSTTMRLLRNLTDPNAAPLRSPPREERDLLVAARNGWVISLDNVSRIPEWLSDAICRLATGGGYSARQLFTDQDEVLFEAMRPVAVNGIPNLAERHDLADRAIITRLPTIKRNIDEAAIWERFDEDAGRILGGVFDCLSCVLQHRATIEMDNLPRMADFVKWIEAAAPALGWRPGKFLHAYRENLREAVALTVEADLVALAVEKLMDVEERWEGSATELLSRLSEVVPADYLKERSWPKAANALSNRLTRAAPGLRDVGIEMLSEMKEHRRLWLIKREPEKDRSDRSDHSKSQFSADYSRSDGGSDDFGGDYDRSRNNPTEEPQFSGDFSGFGRGGSDGSDDFRYLSSDGDAEEREAIQAIDGEMDAKERPSGLGSRSGGLGT